MWFPKCHCLEFVTDFISVTFSTIPTYITKNIESNLANVYRRIQ